MWIEGNPFPSFFQLRDSTTGMLHHTQERPEIMNPDQPTRPDRPTTKGAQTANKQARLVMEAVAVLHARGYGLLKLYCYVKEGLGQWRHWLFASDAFPHGLAGWPGITTHGSIPSRPLFEGSTPQEVAESMLEQAPRVLENARGEDHTYVDWFRDMLLTHPDGVLEMESPLEARIIGYGEISLPALKGWVAPTTSPEEIRAAMEASRQSMMETARERHARRHRGRGT